MKPLGTAAWRDKGIEELGSSLEITVDPVIGIEGLLF
jgi:hypothetical protein